MRKKVAIVTGATGGVGREFVKQLAGEGLDEIWAVARNEEKLEQLRRDYGETVVPLVSDLSKLDSLIKLQAHLSDCNPDIRFLVNNAGIAKMGPYGDFSLEEISNTVDLNCKAPVILSNLCIPYMADTGRILNVSSASAFQPNPYINLYAASKAFERNYSRALHVELRGTGITATAVCPSWIDTELLVKNINGKTVKFPGIVTAEQVVTQAIKDAKRGKDMSVCSLYVKCQHVYVKLLPQKLVMKIWMRGIRKYL